jgi:site-specific DNA recombinase
MLQNRIYRGEIVHKDKSYPGEQEAIVDEALWNKVRKILSTNRIERSLGLTDREPSLLLGVLFDAGGKRMSPTHASKKGIRYRYYVSKSLLDGTANGATGGQRIPAIALRVLSHVAYARCWQIRAQFST